jgi:hypothetical protein
LPRQKRQGQERQGRQVGENAGRLRGYAFALPLVSGIGAAAAVACSFYFFSDRGTVTPPPSPPRTTTATAPSLPPPSPPAPGIVEPAAAAPPPKTSPAAPVEPKEVDPKEVDPKAVEAKAVAPAPDGNTPGKNILDRSEVLALQTQLKALGLNPGPLDGVAGPQTAAAVRRYEESRGRRPTGFVDRDLLMRLQQEQPSKTTRR